MLVIFSVFPEVNVGPSRSARAKLRPHPAAPSRNSSAKVWFKLADEFAGGERGRAHHTEQRHPLAAALGQNGRLEKPLRAKIPRSARLLTGNGSQIAVIMPHLHRSQIRWSSIVAPYAAARTHTCAFKLADDPHGGLQTLTLQDDDGDITAASRRHSFPAPILDEFSPGRLLKTFSAKGRKP